MVCRLRLIVGWSAGSGGSGQVLDLDIVFPPLLVTKATADQIYIVLFHHPAVKPIFAAREVIFENAQMVFDLAETDGAYCNDRIEAFLLTRRRPHGQVYHDHFKCRLHQQQLIETVLVAVAGGGVLSRLYSLTLLLRSGAYLVKLIGALSAVIQQTLVIRDVATMGPPLPEAVAYKLELFSYILVHRKRFQRSQERSQERSRERSQERSQAGAGLDDDGSESEGEAALGILDGRSEYKGSAKGLRQYVDDLRELGAVFNGPYWEPGHH
jgi:hypothetical protein